MIIVTGAAGQLGRGVVESLAARIPPTQIAAITRDPGGAEALARRGVAVREADFARPETLPAAFQGADQVLIVSVNKLGAEALQLHRAAIEAARASGARRIVYTSHMGARRGSPFAPGDQHADTEADLERCGAAYTALRHGFYAESCLQMVGDGLRSGTLLTPEDGPVSWTARADLAEADAAILADPARCDGITPPLTATSAVTMAELAVIASEVSGRDVRHRTVTDQEWLDARIAAGTPAIYAEMLLGMFHAARRGDFAATHPILAELIGRQPKTMHDVLAAALR